MKQKTLTTLTLIKSLSLLLMLLLGDWGLTPTARAEEITVNCTAGVPGLKEAINKANNKTTNPGLDTISLEGPCVYSLTTFDNYKALFGPNGLPFITDPLVINGNGATIERSPQATQEFRILYALTGNLTLQELTIQNGVGINSGGGVAAQEDLTLVNVVIKGNRARSNGGGIYALGATVITGSRFENNHAVDGGGLYAENTLALTNTDLMSNTANKRGGAVYIGLEDMKLTINKVRFLDNKAGSGGAVSSRGPITIENSLFEKNEALETVGGALYADSPPVNITHTDFISNTANIHGGGVSSPDGSIIADTKFKGNRTVTGSGGGLYVFGNATLLNAEFRDNQAMLTGGGAYFYNGGYISGSQFVDNQAISGSGGGLYGESTFTVTESHFENNHAEHSGGGLYAQGPIDLNRSTLISNSARATGSGLFIEQRSGGASNVVNNLWAGNHNPAGAGYTLSLLFDVNSQGKVNVWHNTFAQPSLSQERGILAAKAGITLTDNILANFDVGLFGGAGVVSTYNLFAGNGQSILGSASSDHDLTTDLPLFANPAGGDYHLRAGSPAIDAGQGVGVTVDLDGAPRPQGQGFDIGAYEFDAAGPAPDPNPDPDPNPGGDFSVYLPLVVK